MSKNISNLIKTKKIGLIIYARMSSKRYPGKVLKKIFNDKNVIDLLLDNLKKNKVHTNIIVATSKKKVDKKIINFCKLKGIKYFTGNHENVFLRTKECVKKFKLNYFVRICADRPFFDVSLMKKMIRLIFLKNADIVTNNSPRSYPKGLTCEVAKTDIFNQIKEIKLSRNEKEHIFNYFYNKKNYKIHNIKSNFDKKFLNKNFCLDIKKDQDSLKKIFLKFSNSNKRINTNNLYKLFTNKLI